MKIFYVTTQNPALQGDLQEVSMLTGLREVMGEDVIDVPRKSVMYGDFSASPKAHLHGYGFTYFNRPIADITNRSVEITKDDVVLYGVTDSYGVTNMNELDSRAGAVFYLDGRDPDLITKTPCFKRELTAEEGAHVRPTGFGMPSHMIRDIDLSIKTKLHQSTVPSKIHTASHREYDNSHYVFESEKEYYDDMATSWFGLSCKKGGWDCLRHYEIMACGALLMYQDLENKPSFCAPQNVPAISFGTYEEALGIMNGLVVDGVPSDDYVITLNLQRKYLLEHFTCAARATKLISDIKEYLKSGKWN